MQWLVANLRGTFAVFVVIGGILIFALSRLAGGGGGTAAHWILVGGILSLMVIFGIVVWVRSGTPHAADSDAETFYYLGFIYTLLTLVMSFTPLLAEGSKPSTQQVLGLFGLGLVTTFFGLAGRVFFLQSRTGETLDSNVDRLSRATAEAARSLESTALQISRVGAQIERVSLKSQETLLESIEKATERWSARSQQLFEEANNRIVTLTDNTASHVDQTLRHSTGRLRGALDEFNSKVTALKLPSAELGERLHERVTALTQTTDAANVAAATFVDRLTIATKELTGFSPSLSSAKTELDGLATTASSSTMSFEAVVPAVAQLAVAAKGATDELSSIERNTKGFGATMANLAADAARTAPALSKLSIDVGSTADRFGELIDALSGARTSASKLSEAQLSSASELLDAAKALKAHHVAVQQLAHDLQQDLKASEEAVRKVHSNLIAATEFLTAKIQ